MDNGTPFTSEACRATNKGFNFLLTRTTSRRCDGTTFVERTFRTETEDAIGPDDLLLFEEEVETIMFWLDHYNYKTAAWVVVTKEIIDHRPMIRPISVNWAWSSPTGACLERTTSAEAECSVPGIRECRDIILHLVREKDDLTLFCPTFDIAVGIDHVAVCLTAGIHCSRSKLFDTSAVSQPTNGVTTARHREARAPSLAKCIPQNPLSQAQRTPLGLGSHVVAKSPIAPKAIWATDFCSEHARDDRRPMQLFI